MNAQRSQRTIAQPASIEGRGYWSGKPVKVEFLPAGPNAGITFFRTDLPNAQPIPADVMYRVETPRRTNLEKGHARVEMVEHVLAALAGLQIDNCEVRVNAAELPASDGSCIEATNALIQAGLVLQAAKRSVIRVETPCRVGDSKSWVEARPASGPGLRISYRLDYSHVIGIGKQEYTFHVTPTGFVRDVAPARTFLLEEEARKLQALGYGRHISYQDVLVFGKHGPIGNAVRFPDECVRHKVLDLIGDLALAGCEIRADVRAHRSGHLLNSMLVEAIREAHPQQILKATA